MSWRKLRVLLAHLPEDSHTVRALAGIPVGDTWTITEHMQAAVIDLLAILNWRLQNLGAKKPSKPPRPIPRPSDAADGATGDAPVVQPASLTNWVRGGELL